MLQITETAGEVLARAYEAARRFNPDAKVRVHRLGDRIETSFADSPHEGDQVIDAAGITLFVENGISGTLDVSAEHDRLIVR
jgi:Fe-S cluster assembly iron-binding protein IscA